jgi:1,4-alpha-glucan branching enzyme
MTRTIMLFGIATLIGCAARPFPLRADGTILVPLSLRAPDARSVCLAGNFNRWTPDRHCLKGPAGDGTWTIRIPLPPGRYEYVYVIDGIRWIPDPSAPSVDDGMGGRNTVLSVVPE